MPSPRPPSEPCTSFRGRGRGPGGIDERNENGASTTSDVVHAARATAVADPPVAGAPLAAYLKSVCPQLVELLCYPEALTNGAAGPRGEELIASALRVCGEAARDNWQCQPQALESLLRAAPRCCWRPAYCAFLSRAIDGAPPELLDSVAVMDGIDAFCQRVPDAARAASSEVRELCDRVSGLRARAHTRAQSGVQLRNPRARASRSLRYAEQIQQLTPAADVLAQLDMPTTEAFLFPPTKASDPERAAGAGWCGDMQLLPVVQTWHPIPAEEGWYHLLVQFLLLRADCANGLRNTVACVYEAFVTAAVRNNRSGTASVSDVARALYAQRKRGATASRERPYWNACWVSVGYHVLHGLVYVVELEMPVHSEKRLLNDNIVLLSKQYFDRASPIHVGLIRSLPQDHVQQQQRALATAKGTTFRKRFAFQVLHTLGPPVAFPTEAADGKPYCVVESPVLYSAYNASLTRLKEMLAGGFGAAGDAVWPRSSGLPLESALLAGCTSGPPAYVAACTAELTIVASVVTRPGVAASLDALDAAGWDGVCEEWTEAGEKAARQRGVLSPSWRRCHLLDRTQRAALRHIFSHRVALVQGTPGTGKSFVGCKFIQILLENYWRLLPGPIIVTAVTNHALDAVLQEVLRYMEESGTYHKGLILRLGSGSRANPELSEKCDFDGRTRGASSAVYTTKKRLEGVARSCATSFFVRTTKFFPSLPVQLNTIRNGTLQRLLPSFTSSDGFTDAVRKALLDVLQLVRSTSTTALNEAQKEELVVLLSPMFSAVTAGTVEALVAELRGAEPYLGCTAANVFYEWCKWDKQGAGTARARRSARRRWPPQTSPIDRPALPELQRHMDVLAPPSSAVPPELAAAIRHAADVLQQERDINNMPLFRETDADAGYAVGDLSTDSDDDDAATVADVRVAHVSDSGRAALKAALEAAQQHMDSLAVMLALSKAQRSLIFDAVPDEGRKKLVSVVKEIAENTRHAEELEASNEHISFKMAEQMKGAKIVGGTVNALLKASKALALLKPRVLLVEEAGQVLEGQLIASLAAGLEHLVLVGDHRQLPPQPAEYMLDKKGLGVSLMERLVRIGAPFETLTTQRRMHPEVSQLIHGYYRRVDAEKPVEIEDHPSTHLRPPPLGVRGGVRTLLVSYNPEEDASRRERKNGDLGSFANAYEADLCAALASHLALYNPGRSVVVLSYYSEQRLVLTRLMDPSLLESGTVKVRTVDNFQGEEEDFVILSTVRTERPGFVNVENRACVALSRARMACYVVGCEALLQDSCGVFSDLVKTMRAREPCGVVERFPACCSIHNTPMDFSSQKERAAAACTFVCDLPMGPCGHVCKERCHGPVHERCTTTLCEACPDCHGSRTFLCYEKTEGLVSPCTSMCVASGSETLCGHRVEAPCYAVHYRDMPAEEKRRALSVEFCKEECGKVMPCGHVCPRPCHADIDVDHAVQRRTCTEKVVVAHPACHHPTTVLCGADRLDPNTYQPCNEKCGKALVCGHRCPMACGHEAPCLCSHTVLVDCFRGHKTRIQCSQLSSARACREGCAHIHSQCGHRCSGVCGECAFRGTHPPCEMCAALAAEKDRREAEMRRAEGSALQRLRVPAPPDTPRPPSARPATVVLQMAAPRTKTSGTAPPSSPQRSQPGVHPPRSPLVWEGALPEVAPAAAVAPPACHALQAATYLSRFLTESSIDAERVRVGAGNGRGTLPTDRVNLLEMELELRTLKWTLCERLQVLAASFTCDVDPAADWGDVDEVSSEAMRDVLPLLGAAPALTAERAEAALTLVERGYGDTACAPLLRALVYSSKTHIDDFSADAASCLRQYVTQQQQSQRPLIVSLVLVVAGRVYGGAVNPAFWSSCVCRARKDPAAQQLLDPATESFLQPLRVPSAATQSGTSGAVALPDRWPTLQGKVIASAIKIKARAESDDAAA